MNEQPTEIPSPAPEPVPSEPPPQEPTGDDAAPLSISAHAKAFDPSPTAEPVRKRDAAPTTTEAAIDKTHPSAHQKRDQETGQFRDGKTRRRAQSQQATPDDVPRIKELTRQVRERDEELARLRAGNGHVAAGNGNPAGGRPVAAPAPQTPPRAVADPPRLPPPAHDPEPTPDDPKFGGDYGLYLRHQMAWIARDERRQEQHQESVRQRQQHEEQATKERLQSWRSRVDVAKEKYQDFEAIAFSETPIQKDSVADVLIDQHDNGTDLLYYLQSHPEERDSILQMPEHKQVVALSLLLQRFESNGGEQAGVTGSVASPKIQSLPAKPLNPVRTQAQRAVPVAPPMDGTLGIRAHAEQWHKR